MNISLSTLLIAFYHNLEWPCNFEKMPELTPIDEYIMSIKTLLKHIGVDKYVTVMLLDTFDTR